MATRRLLVVTTVPVDGTALRDQVRRHAGDDEAEVRVVAPVARLSPLQWLANEEARARVDAEQVAREAAEAVEPAAAAAEADVGDTDTVQAIEDALRTFPADELIVVTPRGEQKNWLERDMAGEALERFDLPITHLAVDGG